MCYTLYDFSFKFFFSSVLFKRHVCACFVTLIKLIMTIYYMLNLVWSMWVNKVTWQSYQWNQHSGIFFTNSFLRFFFTWHIISVSFRLIVPKILRALFFFHTLLQHHYVKHRLSDLTVKEKLWQNALHLFWRDVDSDSELTRFTVFCVMCFV